MTLQVHTIIPSIVTALLSTGLRVRSMIRDGLSKNITAATQLDASEERPWFMVLNKPIFVMVDIPHLFKSLRTALLKYKLR